MPLWPFGEAVPQVSPSAVIHPSAQIIGAVTIHERASIWPGAVLRADFGTIEVGPASCIQDNCVIHPGTQHPTIIGHHCIVGHLAHLEGVVIEDAVLVGSGSILLMESWVESGAMVAAGALLTKGTHVPPGHRAQGVPAQLLEDEIDPAFFLSRAERYYELALRHQAAFAA
jgi:carbonic anhydrase/acetyltransferase-like protein (isoleucine patch superfamily)